MRKEAPFEAVVAVDTLVAFKTNPVDITQFATIGSWDIAEAPTKNDYENPTAMHLKNFNKYYSAYQGKKKSSADRIFQLDYFTSSTKRTSNC